MTTEKVSKTFLINMFLFPIVTVTVSWFFFDKYFFLQIQAVYEFEKDLLSRKH